MELFEQAIQRLFTKGGFSHNPFRDVPKTGYMVSLKDHEVRITRETPETERKELFNVILTAYEGKLSHSPEKYFLGGWLDTETDDIYLDISIHIEDLQEAMNFGREHEQLAIYGIEEKAEIYLSASAFLEIDINLN